MKKLLIVLLLLSNSLFAQYTFDKNIKSIVLELVENTYKKGAKGIIATHVLNVGETEYYTVKGHDLFQYIDVFIFTNDEQAINGEIVVDNWKKAELSKNTKNEVDGIINFQFRTVEKFGIKISSKSKEKVAYNIAVSASAPVKNYLSSPFRAVTDKDKIQEKEIVEVESKESAKSGSANNSPLLYAVIGLLIGVVVMVVLKKRKPNVNLFLLFIGLSLFSNTTFAQNAGLNRAELYAMGNMLNDKDGEKYMENIVRERMRANGETSATDFNRGVERYGKIAKDLTGKLSTATNVYKSTKDLYDSYETLSSCMNSSPLPGLPKVPSFCLDNDCKNCFLDARETFNTLRYKFEKLQAIYDCTKRFSKAAIALGDNASGIHAVTGMAWQAQRIEIEKSVISLDIAYAKKRAQFLRELRTVLQEMDDCESAHGLPDWYDRFGYLIYDFMEIRYHK